MKRKSRNRSLFWMKNSDEYSLYNTVNVFRFFPSSQRYWEMITNWMNKRGEDELRWHIYILILLKYFHRCWKIAYSIIFIQTILKLFFIIFFRFPPTLRPISFAFHFSLSSTTVPAVLYLGTIWRENNTIVGIIKEGGMKKRKKNTQKKQQNRNT